MNPRRNREPGRAGLSWSRSRARVGFWETGPTARTASRVGTAFAVVAVEIAWRSPSLAARARADRRRRRRARGCAGSRRRARIEPGGAAGASTASAGFEIEQRRAASQCARALSNRSPSRDAPVRARARIPERLALRTGATAPRPPKGSSARARVSRTPPFQRRLPRANVPAGSAGWPLPRRGRASAVRGRDGEHRPRGPATKARASTAGRGPADCELGSMATSSLARGFPGEPSRTLACMSERGNPHSAARCISHIGKVVHGRRDQSSRRGRSRSGAAHDRRARASPWAIRQSSARTSRTPSAPSMRTASTSCSPM